MIKVIKKFLFGFKIIAIKSRLNKNKLIDFNNN